MTAVLVLANCGGNPLNNGGPTSSTSTSSTTSTTTNTSTGLVVPSDLAGNLVSATYDPNGDSGAGTLTVQLNSLDAGTVNAVYTRDASLDVNGFRAFTTQDSSLSRKFVALVAATSDNVLQAGVVGDGGQYATYYAGTYYSRSGSVVLPTSGIAQWQGKYAGILNTGAGGSVTTPVQAYRTSGDIQMTADFTTNTINGGLKNHTVVDSGSGLTLSDQLALKATSIASDGTFEGTVTYYPSVTTSAGTYGGALGGTNVSDIAGVMVFNPINGNSTLVEHGAFTGTCVSPGTGVPCP